MDASLETQFTALKAMGRLFCRIDVCDGSGAIHRSLPLEFTGSFADYSTVYYDLEQPVTRSGGILKVCMVVSLLNESGSTWEKIKSVYALLELESSPAYSEEDWSDMNGLYEQAKGYAEQAATDAASAEAASAAAEQSAEGAAAQAGLCASAQEYCLSQADNAFVSATAAQASAESAEADAQQAAADKALVAADKADVSSMKTEIEDAFSAVVTVSEGSTVTAEDNHEYRYTGTLTSLTLTLPAGLDAEDRFSAMLSFKTPNDSDITLTYSTADIHFSNDDCENGVFIPVRGKMYDVIFYWNGTKYQGISRGVAL